MMESKYWFCLRENVDKNDSQIVFSWRTILSDLLTVIKSWQELQRNHCYYTMAALDVLRAISYRPHRQFNNFVIRKHLHLATYFLQAAPQFLTIESDMQISGNCKKISSYPELFTKIRKINTCTIVHVFTWDSAGTLCHFGFCTLSKCIRWLAAV